MTHSFKKIFDAHQPVQVVSDFIDAELALHSAQSIRERDDYAGQYAARIKTYNNHEFGRLSEQIDRTSVQRSEAQSDAERDVFSLIQKAVGQETQRRREKIFPRQPMVQGSSPFVPWYEPSFN